MHLYLNLCTVICLVWIIASNGMKWLPIGRERKLIKCNTTMHSDAVQMIWELLSSLAKPKAVMLYFYLVELYFHKFIPIKTTALFSSTPTLDFRAGAGRQTLVI